MLDQSKGPVSGQGDFTKKIPVCEDRYFFISYRFNNREAAICKVWRLPACRREAYTTSLFK